MIPILAAGDNPLGHILQHPLKKMQLDMGFLTPGGEITVLSDQIVMLAAAGLLLSLFLPALVRRRRDSSEVGRLVPTGFANFVEMICEFLRNLSREAMGEHTDRFIKYVWSAFFFVLTINLLGMIPLGTITPVLFDGLHLGGTATTNIWMTMTLAAITFVLMVFNGLRIGGKDYLAHFSPGPAWIAPLLVPVEIISNIAKCLALGLRLFIAMSAGHILLAVLMSLIGMAFRGMPAVGGFGIAIVVVLAAVAISMVELFVAFLQAFIFAYLSALFIGMAVNVHHDDHAHGDHEAGAH